jgi:hypothetical protein
MWESFSVCHARLSVEKSLAAPLRVRPARSSELLITVSAGEAYKRVKARMLLLAVNSETAADDTLIQSGIILWKMYQCCILLLEGKWHFEDNTDHCVKQRDVIF